MPEITHIPVREQEKLGVWYEMKLNFKADMGVASMDDFLEHMGMHELPTLENAMTLSIEQTVPFIPDETMIKAYAKTLKETKLDKLVVRDIRFDGYEYIYPVYKPKKSLDNPRFQALKKKLLDLGLSAVVDFTGRFPDVDDDLEEMIEKRYRDMPDEDFKKACKVYEINI